MSAGDRPVAGDAEGAGPAGDEVRARLVRAAAEVFAREGYAGTRIMDSVREAGVSTGTVYGRFRSKNELLREAVVSASARAGVLASGAPSLGELLPAPAWSTGRCSASRPSAGGVRDRPAGGRGQRALAAAYDGWRAGVEPGDGGGRRHHRRPRAVLFLYRTPTRGCRSTGARPDRPRPGCVGRAGRPPVTSPGMPAPGSEPATTSDDDRNDP